MNTQMTKTKLTAIFNLWAKNYSEDPDNFWEKILDKDGNPIESYGEACAEYFSKLELEFNTSQIKKEYV